MKYMFRICTFALCVCLLACLFGCMQTPEDPTTVPTTTAAEPHIDAVALYAQAISGVEAAKQLSLQIAVSEQITIGSETFTNTSEQTVTYQAKDPLRACVTENATYGSYTTDITEIYADGHVFATVSGSNFAAEMTQEAFTARYAPAILLDASLYASVTASSDASSISFADPTALEAWAADPAAQLISASGTAALDDQGNLVSSTYAATYSLGAATITAKTTVTLSSPEEAAIEVPADASAYTRLTYLDAARIMERSYGYLLQSDFVTSTAQMSIMSQAVGVVRSQQTDINTYGTGAEQMLSVSQSVFQTNYSTGGESSSETVEELFRDGKYTVSINGQESTESARVTVDTMRAHSQELLTGNILDLNYLADATCADLDGLTLIKFACTEALGLAYCGELNYTLFQNETFLTDLASAYATTAMDFYLAVDTYTGVPTAVGISYAGTHTINEISYLLTMQVDQSFDLASLSSYEAITDLSTPDTEPENKATPLFYHVTGADGQEMWLLGTIHVGDDRTAYLPQQIDAAFRSADALAVEFDTQAYTERLKTDTALQAVISGAYYYTDSTTADHIRDAALYAQAEDLMKASGNYNYNTPYLKPSIWNTSLENFYLRQGYRLTSDKGMDTRLLKQAKQQGKTILEIESGDAQVLMLTNWSDALQELLLDVTVSTGQQEYADGVADLYEMWCQGDEAALIEAVKDDLSDMTNEEQKLYEEYDQSMSVRRNALMLDAAKSYLESGDTVFYAVGLAHLLAEDGLVNTLRDAGYTVELVHYE